MRTLSPILIVLLMASLVAPGATALAGSATWKATPVDGLWSNPNNWTPATAPQGSDTATFGASSISSISEGAGLASIGAYQFNAGASAYTISYYPASNFAVNGTGVTNSSGVLQSFVLPPSVLGDTIVSLLNSATAGALTQWTVSASLTNSGGTGELFFNNTSSAVSANIIIMPGETGPVDDGRGAVVIFTDSSTADTSTITLVGGSAGVHFSRPPQVYFSGSATAGNAIVTAQGGTVANAYGADIIVTNTATAGNATFTCEAGAVSGANGGKISLDNDSHAGTATLIAKSGAGLPGAISFVLGASGDSAAVKLLGGTMDISFRYSPGITLGSLEGDGTVFLGSRLLTVGRNRVSTTFSGTLQDEGGSGTQRRGSLAKVGLGSLVLTHANTYTGSTSVNGGVLTVSNPQGSGTGTGPVAVNAGTLGGSGTIAGAVTVGTDTVDRPHLAPASGTPTPATLTIQGLLTFQPTGGYNWSIRAKGTRTQSDRVNANGVTILTGASFTILPKVQSTLTAGTVFTVISNTSATPISGTFSNLADGAVVTIGSNNLQASYSGGDGNDLTLTVVL